MGASNVAVDQDEDEVPVPVSVPRGERLSTVWAADFEAFYSEQREQFDVAFSMSSLDHDGAVL